MLRTLLPVLLLAALAGPTALAHGAARTLAANLLVLVLSGSAGWACLLAARGSGASTARGWLAIGTGCFSWAAGSALRVVWESGVGIAVPYPSPAELGHAAFPILMLCGLWWLAPASSGSVTARRVLDSLMVGCSLGLTSWLIMLDAAIDRPAEPVLERVLAIYYPVADLVLATVVLLTVMQSRVDPLRWGLLAGGVCALTAADWMVALRIAEGSYRTDGFTAWAWAAGFGLIAAAALVAVARPPVTNRTQSAGGAVAAWRVSGVLPYVTLSFAILAMVLDSLMGDRLHSMVAEALVVTMVLLILIRQYLTLRDNRALTRSLRQREAQLHRLAFHDGLTGLANRALFLERLEQALESADRDEQPVSVAFVDLDGFKGVNDALGHAAGDELLARVAQRLRGALRTADTLARIGGDEFAVLIEPGEDPQRVATGMLAAMQAPFRMSGRTVAISASIGVATLEAGRRGSTQAANLLHRADVAMYAVKSAGKGHVLVHSSATTVVASRDEPELARMFAAALENGDIRAEFQPAIDPRSGLLVSLEALARWTCEGQEIPPNTFVPIAERAGLSEHLTAVILDQTGAQLQEWSRALGHRRLLVAVNVNPTEFSDPGLPIRIAQLIDRYGLGPNQLALEITEVSLSNRPEIALEVTQALRRLGVRIALDDFGTGYSTLARLSRMPVDSMKIDRFFVTDIDHDARQRQFLAALIELARGMGLRTIAEGVERREQLHVLADLGCDLAQGFYIGHPAKGHEITPVVLSGRPLVPPYPAATVPVRSGTGA